MQPHKPLATTQFLRQDRKQLLQIGDQQNNRDFTNRRVLVGVDRNHKLRLFHSGQMLDCATDAAGDIQLWRYRLTGGADLTRMFGLF